MLRVEDIEACLAQHGEQIALVLWPGVQFRTGQAFDLARIARAGASRAAASLGFDLAHSIGNMPLALHGSDADFAVWCSYKYLNAGPGAIGGCFVHERHAQAQPRDRHAGALPGARLAGWWGHEEPTRFRMEPQFRAAAGAAAWQISNPPILSAAPLHRLAAHLPRGRHRAAARQVRGAHRLPRVAAAPARAAGADHHARAERRARLPALDPHRRRRRRAGAACSRRSARAASSCDWREPDIIRVAPVPLYNSFEDAWRFAQALRDVLAASGVSGEQAYSVNIVGAGLAGALLALLLARRGLRVALYERRPDPRQSQPERGRSINLALAARGMRALERAGVMERVRPLLIPMRGRMVHEPSGHAALQPYGQRAHEVIYSVGRADLNRVLIEEAARHAGVSVRFNQTCLGADLQHDRLRFRDQVSGGVREAALTPTIATDGAGSVLRASLAAVGGVTAREDWLDHDYKELTMAPAHGRPALERHALHIWPRGGFMLIALPNTDGSFTATLFLPRHGERSFAALDGPQAVTRFFEREFPDALPLHAGPGRAVRRASPGPARYRARHPLARRRARAAPGRCGACHRAVPRPGHERGVRGLRGAR